MLHPQNITIHQEGMEVRVNITDKCDEKSHQKVLKKLKTPWPLVRKRTIPTERPRHVGEVSANFCG
jgi:hypothetical protein